MRPDVEDYAEIDSETQGGTSRAMSWVVLMVAVGGFAALAYYAYHSGTQPVAEGDMLIVSAEESPIKETPENAEGEQFANKDKTIYDVITPGGEKTVEQLLPDSERPIPVTNVEDSEDDMPVAAASPAAVAAVAAAPITAPAPAPGVVATAPTSAPTTFVANDRVVAPVAEKPVEKSYAAPEMINEKKAVVAPAKVAAKPAVKAKAAEKPAAKAEAVGAYKLQLGAFKSEAEAQAAWKKISGAHSDVLKGASTIVKAEVNGSTFYRLRAGSYATGDAAKAACAKLGGQACFPVK